ncbi:MAG: hypothetical protein GEU86_22820 [Actinophytocola sp.]|nr:hypothetical protein [Actinophytocola sp.]
MTNSQVNRSVAEAIRPDPNTAGYQYSGIDPKILSDRVGHANLNVTLGLYVHRSTGLDRDAADLIGKAITDALDGGQEPDS